MWLQFFSQAGHEQSGRRPVFVLSPDIYKKTGLGVFCPITSSIKGYPFEFQLPDSHSVTGVILADQIRSLDRRARKARFVEQVSPRVIAEAKTKFIFITSESSYVGVFLPTAKKHYEILLSNVPELLTNIIIY